LTVAAMTKSTSPGHSEDTVNINSAATVLLIAAAVVWILWRQLKTQPVRARLLVLVPAAMAYFGIRDTASGTWTDSADLALIALGALASAGIGLVRGTTIRVWQERDGAWWSKGTKMTLVLWGALILVRVVLDGLAHVSGHSAAAGLGPSLLSVGLSFAGQNAVIAMRMSGQPFASRPQPQPVSQPLSQPWSQSQPEPQDSPTWQGYGAASGPVDLGRLGRDSAGTDYDDNTNYSDPFGYATSPTQGGYGFNTVRSMRRDLRIQRIAERRADRAARHDW
jgi:hypothetical protein